VAADATGALTAEAEKQAYLLHVQCCAACSDGGDPWFSAGTWFQFVFHVEQIFVLW